MPCTSAAFRYTEIKQQKKKKSTHCWGTDLRPILPFSCFTLNTPQNFQNTDGKPVKGIKDMNSCMTTVLFFSGPVKAGIDVRNGWMIGWLSNGITEN